MTPTILSRKIVARLRFPAALVIAALGVLLAAGCLGSAGGDGAPSGYDPLNEPTFLTPVAEAQNAGVEVYWLGTEFRAASARFEIVPVAEAFPRGDDLPGVGLLYVADTGQGFVTFDLDSFSEEGGGAAQARQQAAAVPGATSSAVRVGPWEAELFSLPGPGRPVNKTLLLVHIGNTAVTAWANSNETGVPGDDPNPLIDADLLIEVVAEHLRPYPE